MDTDKLSESGRVVVSHGLGVTEGFQYGVSLDDLILKVTLELTMLAFISALTCMVRMFYSILHDNLKLLL